MTPRYLSICLLTSTLVINSFAVQHTYANSVEEGFQSQNIVDDSSKEVQVINIPDVNLKTAISEALGLPVTSDINKSQIESLVSLNAGDRY